MKFFVVAFVIGVLIGEVFGAPLENAEETSNIEVRQSAPDQRQEDDEDSIRFRKAAIFGSTKSIYPPAPAVSYNYPSPMPTVPCGRNLLFSCQPSVAPVPCVAPPPSYAGAYSEPIPQWAYPEYSEGY